ncbi:hypothetical protein L227DRAFT_642693 [Lentinus tigrinus ALCF2SS1-6]|uniref:Fungal-type protein kinase domain-containing protein n=1 Tax=Lentinus tigrinus ALCF2SS1-6 TaxID=1328759 RepID=A0A5C2SHZ5_9APHY|nr:hypothetical protein L227DRAFT_642693 [Lentinus tigrinus ALCF2SS1-6]
MLSDASDTSIAMRVFQLLGEMIAIDLIEKNMPTREHSTKVEWAFVSNLRIAPGQQQMRKESDLSESDYSAAWHKVDRDIGLLPGHFLSLSDKYAEKNKPQQKIGGAFYIDEYRESVLDGSRNWTRMGLPVEFKRGGTGLDPFDDRPSHNLDPHVDEGKEVRGQVMSHVEHVFGDQHRTAVYLLFVNGPLFRVMRWDHSGVIVSEPIDYLHSVDGTTCLLTFLNCYAAISPASRGIDTTAVPLSEGSCGWQRMDVVAGGSEYDLDYNEHDIEDASKVHDAFVDPSKGSVSLGTDDCVLHQDPTTRCTHPTTCHRSYPTDVVPEFTHARKYFQDSIADGHPRYMIKVGDMTLLVGRPMFQASGLIGRGTRGFVALDWQSQRLVFLKDSWRPYYEGMQEEGEIIEKLNKAGVPNIPTVLAHGDVEEQETETSNYSPLTGPKRVKPYPVWPVRNDLEARVKEVKCQSPKKPLPSTVAVPDVEYPLIDPLTAHASLTTVSSPALLAAATLPLPSEGAGPSAEYVASLVSPVHDACSTSGSSDDGAMAFKSGKQWVSIILDCMKAHMRAYNDCGYIHRDVSAGNILIQPVVVREGNQLSVYWQGILTDWELAKHKDVQHAWEPDRAGTWDYMSWNLLSYPGDPVRIADELEAFLHVLIYGSVRFIFHDFTTITSFMYSYFHGFTVDDNGNFACPPAKISSLITGSLTDGDHPIKFVMADGSTDHPLNALIGTLLALFKVRYQVLQWKKTHTPQTSTRREAAAARLAAASSTVSGGHQKRRLHDEFRRPRPAAQPTSATPMDVDSSAQMSQESGQKGIREVQPPTEDMLKTAASLENHFTIGVILQDFLDPDCTPEGLKGPAEWPSNDKGPDRLVDYMPSDRAPVTENLQRPPKRLRTDTNTKQVQAEPSTSGSKTARQPRSRRIVAPSDRTTRSKDSTLPKDSRDRGLPQSGPPTKATSRGRGARTATRAANGSAPAAGPSNSRTTQAVVTRTRTRVNFQNGRVGRSSSKRGGKGKASARG